MSRAKRFIIDFSASIIATAGALFLYPILWGWFVVPLGLPQITGVHMMGLFVLVGVFKTLNFQEKDDDIFTLEQIGRAFKPFVHFAMGALWHAFM